MEAIIRVEECQEAVESDRAREPNEEFEEDSVEESEASSSSESASDEEDETERFEDPIPTVLGIDDPRRMQLTREELEWARDVKELIEGYPELENLSDFMYAQLAIISRGDLEDAMRRAIGLQRFRQEYNIHDTQEAGIQCLQRMTQLFPRHLLSFSFSQIEGTYLLIHDLTKLDIDVLTTQAKVDSWMSASYYLHTVQCPDLATIRKGTIVLVECDGMSVSFKKDFRLYQDMFSQLVANYPFVGQMRCFHTNTVFNLLASMFRKVLPSHLKNTLLTGMTFDGRLDTYYLVPDAETATNRVLLRFEETLMRSTKFLALSQVI
ncbi:expressed unknown protein [Seminavis robusta]|uniref:CRAL-TRIO domain-containing protein n=1 Tax=Seminavis robusta TaxID=568900 RepID=A0A9N8E8D3_9STRA|nr:expressed unknown protein [Seminavis robusta]|eukprot:Sro796_g203650.1 n/a (322) ;mRNA; f:5198-6251